MKIRRPVVLLLSAVATALLLFSCDSKRGEPREVQLEKTASELEAKAEKVRHDVEETASVKKKEAKAIRKEHGDPKAAEALEKDATVTREAGEMRAEQLEKKAQEIRGKKEDGPEP